MDANIVDLRYKMKDVLKALEAQETVNVYYHGKLKGTIVPASSKKKKMRSQDLPFFGSDKDTRPVEEVIQELRRDRYHDL
jgi:antitoxin (DNA-binding transcriptional repressor) of toxin-antitoxin stability system